MPQILPTTIARAVPARIIRAVDLLVIHCTATASGEPLSGRPWNAPGGHTAVEIIDRWHRERGFARTAAGRALANPALTAIGYHYVIDLDGTLWTGRHPDETGAHAVGHNQRSVGLCLVGGRERDAKYTAAQWDTLAQLVRQLSRQIPAIPLKSPDRFPASGGRAAQLRYGICGHRDLSPDADGSGTLEPREWLKTCPGFDVAPWLAGMLAPMKAHLLPRWA